MDEVDPFVVDLSADLRSRDDERAEAAVTRLEGANEDQQQAAVPVLQELMCSDEVDVRWWGARALAAVKLPQVARLLAPLLHDPDAGVRQCVALGLRLHQDETVIPDLLAILDDEDPLCASLAADALADIGALAVPSLMEIAQNGAGTARLEAVRALARIGDERSVLLLLALTNQDSAIMEHWARDGLERMGMGMIFFDPD